jgi:hypothetical protein
MIRFAVVAPLVLALVGCRSEVVAQVRRDAPVEMKGAVREGCEVHDFVSATDVPDGAKNLGWVQVKSEAEDEATYLKLRLAICAVGGDGLSSLAWVKEPGDVQPTSLRANAWKLP